MAIRRVHFFPFPAALLISTVLLNGCASTPPPEETSSLDVAATTQEVETSQNSALEGSVTEAAEPKLATIQKKREVKEINDRIAMASFTARSMDPAATTLDRESYAVGPGDVLDIAVFQVEELNQKVRVTGDGYILLPLLGGVPVEGKTTSEIDAYLERELGAKYLQDPQVSVFVDEFKAHQVAVLGAVREPGIYSIERPRTVLEMLSRANGLEEKAGTRVQVRRTEQNPETGEREAETLIMEIDALLWSGDERLNVTLRGGDSIVVPEAGTVFVEGAVDKPGAYPMHGETNVLKALSMAGGILFETEKGNIKVYRQSVTGEDQVFDIDYDVIREDPAQDLALDVGDIVVVHHDPGKRGLANFWKGISGIFRIGL